MEAGRGFYSLRDLNGSLEVLYDYSSNWHPHTGWIGAELSWPFVLKLWHPSFSGDNYLP